MPPHARPFSVPESLYPFEDRWFEREGYALHYIDVGDGVPVVMLHGNPTWSFLYRDVIKSLKGKVRSLSPDYPGFGFSDHPPGYGYTPQEHAGWVAAWIDSLKLDHFILVTQDWGGPIGFAIATQRPAQVAGLVILNTWCWPADAGMKVFSYLMGGPIGKYLHLQRNFFATQIVRGGMATANHKPAAVFAAYRDAFPTPRKRMGTYVFPRAIRQTSAWLADTEAKLGLLKEKPVEMVWAMKDIAFGKESYIQRWKRYFPNANVTRLANAKHYLQEDNPDEIAAAILRVRARL